ncbi:MAG: DUF2635 domain-containing protein [Gemmatimonadales bacterium]|jgi:hypothetical protein
MMKSPKTMFVRPLGARLNRLYHDPERGYLAAEGARVPRTIEWVRAVQCGDVEEFEPEPEPEAKTETKTETKTKGKGK